MGDVVSKIKEACPPDRHDLGTAEGRVEWDLLLRAEINKIPDDYLRKHTASLIREWRHEVYDGSVPREIHTLKSGHGEIQDLAARIERIEGFFPQIVNGESP